MAQKHDERYLSRHGVTLKRFLYYLRGLLACQWIADHQTPPPVLFRELVSVTVSDPAILASIEQLLAQKSRSHEHDQDSVSPLLTDYATALSSSIQTHLSTHHPTPPRNADPQLDHLLYTLASGTHTAGTY